MKNKKNYASKHSEVKINNIIAKKLQIYKINNNITCRESHKIANKIDVSPRSVGINIDMLEIKIIKCQLNLFGYKDKKNTIKLDSILLGNLKSMIFKKSNNGNLTCLEAWSIAKNLYLKREFISYACEVYKIKIIKCQLGAFL